MARANRHFLAGCVWHITHRCHQKSFLLRFAKDRNCWQRWLGEAKRRYGLCVLNYMVTCNHVHLLVHDAGRGEIARSVQLVAGRTAQEFNRRKSRRGAFWEDRYHATAVESDKHLFRCMIYIDLNMVRAGVVSHPGNWPHCGYREIQAPPVRYGIVDIEQLIRLLDVADASSLAELCRNRVAEELEKSTLTRVAHWSESVAVGSEAFVNDVKRRLGNRALGREVVASESETLLRERRASYNGHFALKNAPLTPENAEK